MNAPQVTILYRPVGPKELAKIEESAWQCFPPRLQWQPIFYPVLTEEYAIKIARDWNAPESGVGFVTQFAVRTEYLDRYEAKNAGGRECLEYWVPAEELDEFNDNIVGEIKVIHEFHQNDQSCLQVGVCEKTETTQEMMRNQSDRTTLAQETLKIVERGNYVSNGSVNVSIADSVTQCVQNAKLFTPATLTRLVETHHADGILNRHETRVDVTDETTLEAAGRLVGDRDRGDILCLNFASATDPGGGFLRGAQAQEESLVRSSALYASLVTAPEYYDANWNCDSPLYTDHMILSPNVPVFRNDAGRLLTKPYNVSFLTAPAPNAGAVAVHCPERCHLVKPTMERRIKQVLAIAADERFDTLVLGAWGCGVFENDAGEVAHMFADSLATGSPYAGAFRHVVFAIHDDSANGRIIEPFRKCLGCR